MTRRGVKNSFAVAYAVLASVAAASAQPVIMPGSTEPAVSAFGPDPVIQITTTFRARIEGVADPREVPPITAQDSARRVLYNMAANECAVLGEYWQAECRLNSLTVDITASDFDGPGPQSQVPSMLGTAVYELRLISSGR